MTPEEAAIALRDDPTFPLMSRYEQEMEAGLLLQTDDALEIALAIEGALAAHAVPVTTTGTGKLEECRNSTDENPLGCNGKAPLAGNGRCLTCGANRIALAVVPVQAEIEAPVEVTPPKRPPVSKKLKNGYRPKRECTTLTRKFMDATGSTERQTATLLKLGRTTVQMYLNGQLIENIDVPRAERMIEDIDRRLGILADMKQEILGAIARTE